MFLFDFFRSFLPLHNPIGFGAADFIELALATLLVSLVLLRARVEPGFQRLAARYRLVDAAAGGLARGAPAVAARAAPRSYTGRRRQLQLPAFGRHLAALPPGQSAACARTSSSKPSLSSRIRATVPSIRSARVWRWRWGGPIFGHPWAGVVLSVAALCSLCYWMLRGWTTPGWALVGGLLAVIEFGPLNEWMNMYWGGAVAAAAGCLVFGALPRLRNQPRTRDAVWLGLGLAIHLLTRPYESIFLLLSVILFFLPALGQPNQRRRLVKAAAVAALVVLPAIGLTLLQNREVTGSWTTIPYALSRYQYGVPTTFTFQPNPIASPRADHAAAAHL
jgi:hypothetical protein